jgi:hypothetical protein
MSQEKHYEMLWDCQFCGTKKLLGKTHRHCPTCGAPQNPASRYYPSDSEKVAVEDHVFVGADVTCPACSQLNAASSEFCQQCGSPLKGGKAANTLGAQTKDTGGEFENSGSRDVTKEKFDAEMERVGVKPKNDEAGGFPKWLPIVAVLGIVLCVGIVWFVTRTVDATVIVVGHEWTRDTDIEQYNRFTESSWWDVPPFGDNVLRGACSSRQRDTKQVYDGEECRTVRVDRGDGTFSESQQCTSKYRSEPVYDDWCTYTGTRWNYRRDVVMNGGLDDTPTWGAVEASDLQCMGQSRVGCERIASQNEVYNIVLKGDEFEYKCPLSADEWRAVRIETVYTMKVNALNKANGECDSLKKN